MHDRGRRHTRGRAALCVGTLSLAAALCLRLGEQRPARQRGLALAAGGLRRRGPGRRARATSAAALSPGSSRWAVPGSRQLPAMPNSTEAMCRQAANAVMQAYRDGYTRQSVRLRTDIVFRDEAGGSSQMLLQRSLPLAKSFAAKLWGGESLRQVRISQVDDEVGTLLYREAENAIMDAAVFYLPGRALVTSPRVGTFFENMGDRLVVLANSEQAPDPWKVENKGQDFYLTSKNDVGTEVCQTFDMQAFYFHQTPLNNWQLTFFRVYPAPWQIFIEDLNFNMVMIGTSPSKPDYNRIRKWMEAYEKRNGIGTWKKVGKMLKDQELRRPLGMDAR